MNKITIFVLLFIPFSICAQIGIKGGVNFANITKSSSINNSSRSGFHAGFFVASSAKKVIGSRTELMFSRQGYNYKTSTNTGSVNLDYIMLPQYMSINITKYFSILFGAQIAYLLNAKADSADGGGGMENKTSALYNRLDYGYGGGVEVHPVGGLIIGARVNISLGNLYKTPEPGEQPSYIPKVNVKNNLFQVYSGWKFGNKK